MTQSLLNFMDSPLGIIALLLWGILLILTIRKYYRWVKAKKSKKVIYQNHPAIPLKEYKLSEFEPEQKSNEKVKPQLSSPMKRPHFSPEEQKKQLASLTNLWDV